jgi:outer membrane protein assembly factor BamB
VSKHAMPHTRTGRLSSELRRLRLAWLPVAALAMFGVSIDAQTALRRPSAKPATAKPAATKPDAPAPPPSPPANWTVWGGPNRDFKQTATGLAPWALTGPKKVWSRRLGEGYSGLAVEGDRLYTMYRKDTREIVAALDAKTGETVWQYPYYAPFSVDVGPGPYAMPQVLGDRLLTVGATGKVHSIDKRTGKPVWSHDLYEEYSGSRMQFGYSCHALPYRDMVIFMVGGRRHAITAFKQSDGSEVWSRHRFNNSHSSPLLINVDGQDQVVALMGQQVIGIEPTSGELLWEHAHPTQYDLAVSTPSWGPDNILVVSSSYDGGTRALRLTQSGGKTTVQELWHNSRIRVHFGSLIRVNQTMFGSSGHDGPAPITAFDVASGKVLWNSGREFAKSQLLWADGKLIVLDQDGVLALMVVDRQGFKVLSRAELLQHVAWTPPTLVGTRLYIRDRGNIMALDLAGFPAS